MKSLADQLPPEIARQIPPAWRKNETDYWAVHDQLLSQYKGQWIGFADGIVIAVGTSPVAVFHAAGLLVATGWSAVLTRPLPFPASVRSKVVQTSVLAISLFAASFMLFWIDPSDRHLNLFIRLFFTPPFPDSPAPFGLGPALFLATLLVAAVAALGGGIPVESGDAVIAGADLVRD